MRPLANDPTVALGIVTRDRAAILRTSINSALTQKHPSLAVYVVDDGSRDETDLVKNDYSSVWWHTFPTTEGYLVRRNYLMRETNADYYVSLDDDAWFLDGDEIGTAIGYLETHPHVGVVGFDILSPDRPVRQSRSGARSAAVFIGCGHVLRMAAVQQIGYYAASPGRYGGEEKDLALRLLDAGYSIAVLPGVHVWHDKTMLARVQPDQHCSGVCNDLAMTLRRTPFFALPIALMAKIYRHFRFSRAHCLEDPFWEGVKLFTESVPELWRTRRPVRASTLRAFLKLTKKPVSSPIR